MIKEKNLLLKKELKKLISLYSNDGKIKEIIEQEFIKRKMLGSKGTQLFSGNKDLFILSDEDKNDLLDLFIFTYGFYNALIKLEKEGYEKIDINNYFTKVEIEEWLNYVKEIQEVTKYPYVFKNVDIVADGHFRTIISAKELADIDAGNDILYLFSMQRDPRINVLGFKEINIDKDKIKTIKERLIAGKQFSDDIKLNVLHNGEDNIEYNPKTRTLTINSGIISCYDGYHRKCSNNLAILESPNLEFNWGLIITNFSEKKAQDFMVQINEQKPIRKEHISNINSNISENVVVDFIKDIPMNDFSDMITESDDQIKRGIGLTKKSILANAIKECFDKDLEIKSNIKVIANHISDVINYIIGLNLDSFINIKNPIMTSKNIFIGYIALAKNVYTHDDWKDEVKQVLSSVDFSESNELWKEIGLLTPKDASKTLRDKLYKIFSI